jgi:hypothetical protein
LKSFSLSAAVCSKSAPLFKTEQSTNSFTGRGKAEEEEEEEEEEDNEEWGFSLLE